MGGAALAPGADDRGPQRPERALLGGAGPQQLDEVVLGLGEDGEGDLVLVGEVAEEGALRDVDRGGDLVDGGAGEALPEEEPVRGLDEGVPGALLLPRAQPGLRRGGGRGGPSGHGGRLPEGDGAGVPEATVAL